MLLRRLREASGLTQEELAARAALSAKGISDLERGARRRPHPQTVRALADALELSEDGRASLLAAVPKRGGVAHADPSVTEFILPTPPASLVGRERGLEEVTGFLRRPEVRLLTLTGTGGVGKTRLALQAARDARAFFSDGVAFVALAYLNDAEFVVPSISRSLGLREAAGQSPREALGAYLRDKRLLLVLDNFEHLLEAAPEVSWLVETCPDLTVLVTSRAPLRVGGEQEYPVPPLELPVSTRDPGVEEVLGSPSGRLFVERAREASPVFTLTGANAAAVASICWRLAGLPLALELAAARMRFLSPSLLLVRLDRALSTSWSRYVADRQRTMRATLDWSHDLLNQPERALFRRLAVFAGGFTLDAAEAVGATRDVADEDVLGLLGALVEQSLVTAEPGKEGAEVPRYGMLEPVRHYALEKLEESGEGRVANRSHTKFFLDLAERAYPGLRGPDQAQWLDRLEREHGNLRTAVARALSAGETETATRFGWALWVFWWLRGHQREGRRWMEMLLEHDLPANLRAIALVILGHMDFTQGDYESSEGRLQESLGIAERGGDKVRAALAVYILGLLALNGQETEAARLRLEEALCLYLEICDGQMVSSVRSHLGVLLLIQGDLDGATSMMEEGLGLARKLGDPLGISNALYNLAQIAQARGNHDLAARRFEEGVAVSEEMGDRANLGYFLEGLAVVAGVQGDVERSARLFGAAEGLLQAVEAPVYDYYEPNRSFYQRTVASVRAKLGEEDFEEARDLGRAMGFEQAVEYALDEAGHGGTGEAGRP
jgi:predicted ATPase/DNA-binding XRE family transcriptional regulator/Tfp pilus assembly protein PilF